MENLSGEAKEAGSRLRRRRESSSSIGSCNHGPCVQIWLMCVMNESKIEELTWYELIYRQCLFRLMHSTGGDLAS